MKKILFLLMILPAFTFAQKMSCCMKSTTESFTALASSEKFAAAHLAPLPFNYEATKGTMITFKCEDGQNGNAFEVKAENPTNKWLIVIHEWWGLNDYIKREAEHWAEEIPMANVLAIDLYDGKVAEKPEVAQTLMQGVKDERARAIIKGAIAHMGKDAAIATIGWCFGGGWSLQSSLMAGKNSVGCVMYYGMPENNPTKLKELNSDVLGIFARNDDWITPEIVKTFQANMSQAGKNITVRFYDADHAFANPSNPKYNKEAAESAHQLAFDFLKYRLK